MLEFIGSQIFTQSSLNTLSLPVPWGTVSLTKLSNQNQSSFWIHRLLIPCHDLPGHRPDMHLVTLRLCSQQHPEESKALQLHLLPFKNIQVDAHFNTTSQQLQPGSEFRRTWVKYPPRPKKNYSWSMFCISHDTAWEYWKGKKNKSSSLTPPVLWYGEAKNSRIIGS